MILLLDHQDSFVHTLAGYLRILGEETLVRRDDEIDLDEIIALDPRGIVLSPGPCTPAECPLARDVALRLGASIPILGVCLGHQVIATAFGGIVTRSRSPRHGMTSVISHDERGIYAGIPSPIRGARYHSLSVVESSLPDELSVSARADDGEIMGIRHTAWPIEGVQFHPESVATEYGLQLMENWSQQLTP